MNIKHTLHIFAIPIIVFFGIGAYLLLNNIFHYRTIAIFLALILVVMGSWKMIVETVTAFLRKQFALDYIAILAILVSIFTGQYLVALVIVLMLSSGTQLEEYGMTKAQQSLTALSDRIPKEVMRLSTDDHTTKVAIASVVVGERILVRKGEVVPLDGVLESTTALTDESSLTGEPYMLDKLKGDQIRSGIVNMGDVMIVLVTKTDDESTYRKIIGMVQEAQQEKAPLIRLADRYSTIFTIITLVIATFAYLISHDIGRVLAVLVVATPCPLILATPIALFGGMNAAAKRRVLVKRLSALEVLARVTTFIFDKTGTLTLGKPTVTNIVMLDNSMDADHALQIAEAIERNSLHPIAKAIVDAAREKNSTQLSARDIMEETGVGISAIVEDVRYHISKMEQSHDINAVELKREGEIVARIEFEDTLKQDSTDILKEIHQLGVKIHIFTGDKKENAEKILLQLGDIREYLTLKADCSPTEKKDGVAALKAGGEVTAMVGDGINDAPALALADVGMVFSNEEQTAASEAADIVFLGGDLEDVKETIRIAKRTINIALQSIIVGIGLSIVAMIFAALGYIPAIAGALLQEAIDVAVILNALRASRG
ncbi:MAG: cadmium-translocating P-type ATPase [Candidatus Magasanikbacteria bacterium CG_4_9_14_0_2_um_filter_41_10]|uniref:Cadmium-translocating P-type ATPase n=1 Tax=Candidatus Magasanikbacteria bacterium CG_4_10_14_0_2_um_filter_41_31 TaxID=1974639 RepID=A0A2M7V2G6_9BACT|nr:MAG: cadmium-translocating P-type ATPase [Candidatus Magasanikbacteria bacterium CG1_02_41_34]PIZ92636.1 MAG: cadmium-translocating P-type ATPase [Candidatus Magasanikbacteria bacterium CG_4_10_14_0_2_um_filter_41_31]PJC53854.1 MAG: cadmium-translocating P-type ATPase [Candidatus Magasanikbacteria bacterium CG_4_9_14_0_2_um_filter_41_10]